LQFNCILGRNIYRGFSEQTIASLTQFLEASGRWVLAETMPQAAQRLYAFLDRNRMPAELYDRLSQSEESHYQSNGTKYLDLDKFNQTFVKAGFVVTIEQVKSKSELYISEGLCDRWFGLDSIYMQQLSQHLEPDEVERVRALFLTRLLKKTVNFEGTIAYMTAVRFRTSKKSLVNGDL
jgi:putative ATPase